MGCGSLLSEGIGYREPDCPQQQDNSIFHCPLHWRRIIGRSISVYSRPLLSWSPLGYTLASPTGITPATMASSTHLCSVMMNTPSTLHHNGAKMSAAGHGGRRDAGRTR